MIGQSNKPRRRPSVIGTAAACWCMSDALNELERKNSVRYAEFWLHFNAAMDVLNREGLLSPTYKSALGLSRNKTAP